MSEHHPTDEPTADHGSTSVAAKRRDSQLADRVAGGSTGPWVAPFVVAGMAVCDSWSLWQGAEAGPGGGYRGGPRPGSGDVQPAHSPAADQSGGGVQDLVAQGFRLVAG